MSTYIPLVELVFFDGRMESVLPFCNKYNLLVSSFGRDQIVITTTFNQFIVNKGCYITYNRVTGEVNIKSKHDLYNDRTIVRKYKGNSKVIEAIKLVDTVESICACETFVGMGCDPQNIKRFLEKAHDVGLNILTPKGVAHVYSGDYIIKSDDGFYPCKPDVFEKIYELINIKEPIMETNVNSHHIDDDVIYDGGCHMERELQPHETRLITEFEETADRFEKLMKVLPSEDFRKKVGETQYELMNKQATAMRSYLQCLAERMWDMKIHCRSEIKHTDVQKDVFGYKSQIERMTFGDAIVALKAGECIARKGWNGKGLFVCKQVPSHINEVIIPKMQSLPQSAKGIIMSREDKHIDYTNQMLIIHPDGRADSWVPSVSDIFAEDWKIVYYERQI